MRLRPPYFLRAILILGFLALSGCSGSHEASGSKKAEGKRGSGDRVLAAAEASALIRTRASDPAFVILDVRTPSEFATERIAGARNIDFHSPAFQSELSRLDRARTYLVYCRSGNRSGQSLPILRDLGFRDVLHLEGGISAWKDAGQPVEVSAATP